MKLKDVLRGSLHESELKKVVKSYDIVGDIIVIRVHPDLESKVAVIAEALHTIYPRVRTIAAVPLHSHTAELYRTRDLAVIWGDERMETTHKECGCSFTVNLKQVFFSPRLSYERMRVAGSVSAGETIINMFSGVGCFSILIAKMQPQTTIYSIDVNPSAIECMKANAALNRVEGTVIPVHGDAGEALETLEGAADRVLMPLPERAYSFLPLAVRALKRDTGGVIHYYDVSTGRKDGDLFHKPVERVSDIVSSAFGSSWRIAVEEKRVVRSVAPRTYHVVLDLRLERQG
jgi:tRNA (guanine37-N1)-methyltransferase